MHDTEPAYRDKERARGYRDGLKGKARAKYPSPWYVLGYGHGLEAGKLARELEAARKLAATPHKFR